MAHDHDCSCHLSPPCGRCENCAHPDDDDCPENDCQNCACIDRAPRILSEAEKAMYARMRERYAMLSQYEYVARPYYLREWGYAEVRYFIRPEVNGERWKRVIDEIRSRHTSAFGFRVAGRVLTIYTD